MLKFSSDGGSEGKQYSVELELFGEVLPEVSSPYHPHKGVEMYTLTPPHTIVGVQTEEKWAGTVPSHQEERERTILAATNCC